MSPDADTRSLYELSRRVNDAVHGGPMWITTGPFWILDFGFWILDLDLDLDLALDLRFEISDFRFWIGFQISDLKFQI